MLELMLLCVPPLSCAGEARADSLDMLPGGHWRAIAAEVHQNWLPISILNQGSGFLLEISLPHLTKASHKLTLIPSGVQTWLAVSLHQKGYISLCGATARHQLQVRAPSSSLQDLSLHVNIHM